MEPQQEKQPSLTDKILHWGELGFDPELPETERVPNQTKFYQLIDRTGILALMPVLSFLIQPGRVPPWLRQPLMSALAVLPLRERGVQNTIEFVLSVHPSNSRYDGSSGGTKGSGISHEALNAASRLLSAPPSGVSQERWFLSISPQLFSLLQGEGEPEMDRAAAFIIGFGILGRKQYGAPGMPGWKAFVEPMLHRVDPSTFPISDRSRATEQSIVTLGASKILVSSDELARSLQRLASLLNSHPNPSLTRRLLRPIMLPLWALSSWPDENEKIVAQYRRPAGKLLKTFLQLSSSVQSPENPHPRFSETNLSVIVRSLMFNGRPLTTGSEWTYASVGVDEIHIQETERESERYVPDLARLDHAANCLIDVMKETPDLNFEISGLFTTLCAAWLKDSDTGSSLPIFTHSQSPEPIDGIKNRLVEAKILQKMMAEIPEQLVSDSRQVLGLVDQVLSQSSITHDVSNEDTVAVALSLLNMIFTSPGFQETAENKMLLGKIQRSLNLISQLTHLDSSSTARNLVMLLKFRSIVDDPDTQASSTRQDQLVEDRKIYHLALSYLTATESPPPVRVQGLELISGLVKSNSPILDIPALLVLFASLLQDGEEYIYLRVIKSFTQLSERHPHAVMKDLIDRYVDPNEELGLDERLRTGEGLLQVVEGASHAFTGEVAALVSTGLLAIAGRRGFRPRTEKSQEKKELLRRKKDKDAEDAWNGDVPQLDELLENETQEEYDLVSQIVSGWESKRGTEDVRIRASAVSILAAAIHSNVAGVGSTLISTTIDLSIHILTLEPEPEKGILRRSAILLIMSFIQALEIARANGRKLGFGFAGQSLDDVQRILKYVGDTDSDGLVRRHANDVVESLHAWQLNTLLPSQSSQSGINELAGLSIFSGPDSTSRRKPRIEEIE